MPVINGLEFPEPEFCEYPKVLYLAGQLGSATLIVDSIEAERDAAPDFLPLAGAEAEVRREPADAPVVHYARPECQYEVCPCAADCQAADACAAQRPDTGGQPDQTGEVVAPNPGRRGKK